MSITPEQFKASAHSVGSIMGVKGLGKTGESYCKEWYLKKTYNRKKDFFSKYVDKGLAVEHVGIEMLGRKLTDRLWKNDEYFSNEFVEGFPDVIHDDTVWDIKSSWDLFSYPFFDTEIPNKDYFFQLQAYMWLTGLNKAALAYCLIDTPRPLVDQELKKLYYQTGGKSEDWSPETYEELYVNYRFDDIPEKDRIKIFEIKRDESVIKQVEKRVKECRTYLETILPKQTKITI
jgi:hypothetical protein